MKRLVSLLFLLFLVVFPTISFACVSHWSEKGLNGPTVYVQNNCGRTVDVNICITFRGQPSFQENRNSTRLVAGGTWNFHFFRPGHQGYRYGIRWCEPNRTLRTDICRASCP